MSQHLFTYGTLELEQVFETITGMAANGLPARVENFSRYLLKGESYPGIVAAQGSVTHGTLYLNIDQDTLQKIINYEDSCYEHRMVNAITDDGKQYQAMAFVIPEEKSYLLSEREWDQKEFSSKHLDSFLRYIS